MSELAGLLAPHATAPEPAAPGRYEYPRAEFRRSAPPRDERPALLDDDLSGDDGGFAVPAAPSPFTAALARMVAGDRDVRQAVREALDGPAAPRPRGDGDSWRSRPGAFGPADTPVAPPAARQKEETVGDQVIAPSTSADQPVGVPAWAAEPEVLVPSVSSREEAIAEVLRSALAQGHSDDALAGILRKVLAGVAPQTALAEPELAVPVRPLPEVVLAAEAAPSVVAPVAPVSPVSRVSPVSPEVAEVAEPEAPVAVELPPVFEPAVPAVVASAPAAAPSLFPDAAPVPAPSAPAVVPPAPVYAAPTPLYAAPAPLYAAPAPLPLPPLFAPPVGSMWGDPSPAPLWGDPVTVAVSRVRQSDAPIWAEVTHQQAAPELTAEAGSAHVAEPADVAQTVAASVEPVGTETADTDAPVDLVGHDPARIDAAAHEVVADGFTMVEAPADEVVADETPAVDDLSTVDDVPAAEAADGPLAETALEGPVDAGSHTDDAETTVDDIAATVVDVDMPALDTDVPVVDADVPVLDTDAPAVTADVPVLDTDVPALDTDIHVEDAATTAADIETGADTEIHTVGSEATAVGTQADERVEIPVADQVDEVPGATAAEDVPAEAAADEAVEVEAEVQAEVEAEVTELAPTMARTASDPAPMMSFDATTVMPPLSLLPPLPSSRGRGRPPVPPASRPLTPRAAATSATPPAPPAPDEPASPAAGIETSDAAAVFATTATRSWATVTRLPVAPLMATPETPEMPELDTAAPEDALSAPSEPQSAPKSAREQDVLAPEAAVAPMSPARNALGDLRGRLEALGVPGSLLGATFADDVAGHGTYAALTRALAMRLPAAPELPCGAGEVLFVVGPGFETLRAARSLAASLRLDPDSVQWATRGELAGLAPKSSRVTTVETALDRRQDAAESGTVTIVAVDAPMRTDAYWMSQMLAIWSPAAVWVVVEATRKPEDLEPWIDGLPRVDALIVTDTDLSADPAAVLRRVPAPVAMLDGVRATPHRWASLLCERLESTKA
ncbi:hypothetical protein E4P39_21855 [Blastococcus sp. CT_GayMR19]|uniref:hypothetical protein n=1 Tax=Blastococcus sp. CT_GayMR19 TaxID=2559608 RepID=UPI0010742262|nr:hypothetical protein [Blastococcus sp. CT_GayMR19]TFV69002.1 hypothetical protein E4P39_21855 [Blastococcus sp. CT_GayMR19]